MVVYRMYNRSGQPVAVSADGKVNRGKGSGPKCEKMRRYCTKQFKRSIYPVYGCYTDSELRDGSIIDTYATPGPGRVPVTVGHLAPAPHLAVPA